MAAQPTHGKPDSAGHRQQSDAPPSSEDLIRTFMPHMQRIQFQRGDVLFRKGDPADRMFAIAEGSVILPEIDKTLGPGEFIGEMGLFCPVGQRTVSAVCEGDLTAYAIGREGVLTMMDRDPRLVFGLIQLAIGRFAENLRTETAQRERMESELRIAREIQASSLPDDSPAFPERDDFELAACMDPAREVGGDFYDYFLTADDELFFTVGDVSGKGVPAALFMMKAKTLIKNEALTRVPPKEVLRRVNQLLASDNRSAMFATVLCGVLNLTSGAVRFGNAGHNPPIVVDSEGHARELDIDGSPVAGFFADAEFTEGTGRLRPGDTVFLYTDGIPEAVNPGNEQYSEERLLDLLAKVATGDLRGLPAEVRLDVARFAGAAPQFDDVTMLAVRFRGSPPAEETHIRLQITADTGCLETVQAMVGQAASMHPVARERRNDVELAVEEIVANLIRHAYPETGAGPVQVTCRPADPAVFAVEFRDRGAPFDATSAPDPDLPDDIAERQIGGLGIYLLKQVTDALHYCRKGGENILTFEIGHHRPEDRRPAAAQGPPAPPPG